jgi:hypothetical protein
MWILRNGKRIRVDIYLDPIWNKNDVMSIRNLVARFMAQGHTQSDAASLASAALWKRKWPETVYRPSIEKSLTVLE